MARYVTFASLSSSFPFEGMDRRCSHALLLIVKFGQAAQVADAICC